MRTARRSEPPNMCARVGIGLLKERYADQVQCVARYKPNRDGNHHGDKRNASNLNDDRAVDQIAFHSVHCRVSAREKGRRRPLLSGTSPAFKLCAKSNRLQVGFFLTEYVAYLLTVANRARSLEAALTTACRENYLPCM